MQNIKNQVRSGGALLPAVATVILLAGCEVVNPGQILDADLDNQAAMRVLVTGMAGDFVLGHRDIGWNNAVLTGDLAGTSAYLSRQRHWEGRPEPEDADEYDSVHAALWVATDGIRRMKAVMGSEFDSSPLAAEAHLWAGYASRLLGETMCQAVIEGGAPQPRDAYFQIAEDHFSAALSILDGAPATDRTATLRHAALGGRASVRVVVGDWDGAVADAAGVPDEFVFYAQFNGTSTREQNRIWNESQSRVNLNAKYTFFEGYWDDQADPRAPVFRHPEVTVSADGVTEQLMQGKYNEWGADIPLTKGAEMRLVEAEHQIRTGNWPAGLQMVNDLRDAAGVDPRVATSAEEALHALRLERSIVLWLEARRGGDLYRFGDSAVGDPIVARMYENAPSNLLPVPVQDRAICHPFSLTMIGTNAKL